MFGIHLADWPEKYFFGQSTRRFSRVILSPCYTRWFSSSIDLVVWPVQREHSRGEFQKKRFNEAEEIANRNMGARKQCSSIGFLGGFIKGISSICIANLRDFYTVVFGCEESQSRTQA